MPTKRLRAIALVVILVGAAMTTIVDQVPAYGDAHAPPPFPPGSDCPAAQFPPAGYPLTSPPIPYEIPFKGIIFGGEIDLPPFVKIPNLYASICGLVQLPQLSGTIFANGINFATPGCSTTPHASPPPDIACPPNIYVAKLEALPASVTFGDPSQPKKPALKASINLTPAHNGGLDITLSGSTTAAVATLGMSCSITVNATFTTLRGAGLPVTGPTKSGQAEVFSNTFPSPAVRASTTCPAPIAQTFNKLLGLPQPAGVGTFVAPFCFDFELEGLNTPTATKSCPWPK